MVIERFVSQFDGCAFHPSGDNCTCASEAMWLFRASQGKIVETACHVRGETHDTVGGTNLGQMEKVSIAHGITSGMLYQPVDIDHVFGLVETDRYASHLNIHYDTFVGTPYDRFHGGFRGNHDIFLSARGATAGTIRVGDPGAKGFVDIPKTLLKTAAGRLDLGNGVTINNEYGGGKCYSYVTPADPAVSTTHYLLKVFAATKCYNGPQGSVYGTVTRAHYTVRRSHEGGLWWYTVLAPGTSMNGKSFKATSTIKVFPI